ncbi:MAG TPA: TetR/AcrR family transcriptional regulator, partial [Bryobacteraceae bacterium]|nr:TetR/AcrR family transcriptional regulator [Bryobacteraceae bacterium]
MSGTSLSSSSRQDDADGLTSARRTPMQGRSQETVQRILNATSRLLERIPLEEITTSRIAQESGVSVGGLYRFFPDKQAIIDAIAVQHVKEF